MKSANPATPTGRDPSTTARLGSEYMDAQSYLTQPTRAPKVQESDPTFHGSNDSDFGSDAQRRAE